MKYLCYFKMLYFSAGCGYKDNVDLAMSIRNVSHARASLIELEQHQEVYLTIFSKKS